MAPPSRTERERAANERSVSASRQALVDIDLNLYFDGDAVPKGSRYKWVRELCVGMHDKENVSRRLRQGYRPVPAERHPEAIAPCLPGEQPDTLIRRGGMLLMEQPEEIARREDAHLRADSAQAMFAVDRDRQAIARRTTGEAAIADESTSLARGRFEER